MGFIDGMQLGRIKQILPRISLFITRIRPAPLSLPSPSHLIFNYKYHPFFSIIHVIVVFIGSRCSDLRSHPFLPLPARARFRDLPTSRSSGLLAHFTAGFIPVCISSLIIWPIVSCHSLQHLLCPLVYRRWVTPFCTSACPLVSGSILSNPNREGQEGFATPILGWRRSRHHRIHFQYRKQCKHHKHLGCLDRLGHPRRAPRRDPLAGREPVSQCVHVPSQQRAGKRA
jgi:hypothetical protein